MAEEEKGLVDVKVDGGVGTVEFFHPKKNSMPGILLRETATAVTRMAANEHVRVVVLRSGGEGPFCAGASFDELVSLQSVEQGKQFFMGFASLILAMRACPKFVVCRVQGKAVGGGVGVVSAADYAIAVEDASIRLSEFALGFGPFVIGPAVDRKLGRIAFAEASIDTDWRDAAWAKQHGLYAQVVADKKELDKVVRKTAATLADRNPEATEKLKRVFWEGTDHWETLMPHRAEMSARLALTAFVQNEISRVKRR